MRNKFKNLSNNYQPTAGDMWRLLRTPRPKWEKREAPFGEKPPERVHGTKLRTTMVNHMTLLIQTQGVNIITDPIWSQRCSPVQWAGPGRFAPPGIRFSDLPPIDIVLLSHDHYDHMDETTLKRLNKAFNPTIVTGLGNRRLLEKWGMKKVIELDWWEGHSGFADLDVFATPAQHFSGRGVHDRNSTLWLSFWLQTPGGGIYFAGDTGMGEHFEQIHSRFGAPRLSLLPIGAYKPTWFMAPVHMSPKEAWDAHKILNSFVSVGTHYGTFALAMDAQDEPEREIQKMLLQDPGCRFWLLANGEGREIPLPNTQNDEAPKEISRGTSETI